MIYMNARFYVPYINRFISADTIVPDPARPQSFNRYSYVNNSPLAYTDPSGHSCADALEGYPAEQYDCMSIGVTPLVFYLNGLGGRVEYPRVPDGDINNYILYALSLLAGAENVIHVPLFTEAYRRGPSQLDMIGEALGIGPNQTQAAVEFVENYHAANPLQPGQQLVLVGNSAGGTVAIEALRQLEERGIYVDQVILRGSLVHELSISNVGRVDYIAADPPQSDKYYSVDINPFDSVTVNEHQIFGFSGHIPQTSQ